MEKYPKEQSGEEIGATPEELMDRRDFLLGLKKWSKVVIGVALLGSGLLVDGADQEAAAGRWANARGGGGSAWANHGGGGGGWANGRGGGGAWVNGRGGGGGWANRGGSWVNRF
jgi:hypothetical protein